MREPQKGKLLWFLAAPVCTLPGKTSKFNAVGLFLRQLQTKSFESLRHASLKLFRIIFVLKACQIIVCETEVIRLATILPDHFPAEPQIQHIVKVDVRQQWR